MSRNSSPASRGQASVQKPSFLRSLRTVAWGFFGVRKNSEYQDDLAQVNPFHLIIAVLLGALCFIGVLLLVVRWVVATA